MVATQPGQRRRQDLGGDRPAFFFPRGRSGPPLRRPGGKHRSGSGLGQDALGPGDGLLDQRGDREPSLACAGPQPFAQLVDPGAAPPQAGQVGLGCRRVDQDGPGGHRHEGRRPGVRHGGDRVIRLRRIDDRQLLGNRPRRAVQRDRIGRCECPACDRRSFRQELARPRRARPAGPPRSRPGPGRRTRECRTCWPRTDWSPASGGGSGRPGHVLRSWSPIKRVVAQAVEQQVEQSARLVALFGRPGREGHAAEAGQDVGRGDVAAQAAVGGPAASRRLGRRVVD